MGSFLEKPQTAKEVDFDENELMQYGLACMQGWRMEMEDAHTTCLSLPIESLKSWSFFAVYDGHAGSKVAKAASERLLNEILDTDYFKTVLQNDEEGVVSKNSYDCDKIRESVEQGFLRLDTKLFKEELASGSTAVGLLITPKHYFYINCGDSRACHMRSARVGCDWKGLAQTQHPSYVEQLKSQPDGPRLEQQREMQQHQSEDQLRQEEEETQKDIDQDRVRTLENNQYFVHFATKDHKPVDDEERNRIENAGGMVIIQRINGALAVSRALGDFDYKRVDNLGQTEQLVSPLPIVTCFDRCSDSDSIVDSYSIIACDGIFDAITNENLQKYVSWKLKNGEDVRRISKDCLDLCLNLGSRDNMSIVILKFKAGQPTAEDDEDSTLYKELAKNHEELFNKHKDNEKEWADFVSRLGDAQTKIDAFMSYVEEKRNDTDSFYSSIFRPDRRVPGGGAQGTYIQFRSNAEAWLADQSI